MAKFRKYNKWRQPKMGELQGSKPSLNPVNPNMDIDANKNAASINTDGVAEKGSGTIYMTHTITKTTVSTITDEVLGSVGISTDRTCCEGTDLVTAVVQNTTNAVTVVNTTETTEDIFLPVVFEDVTGKIREVIMIATSQESSYGREFVNEPPIEGETPIQ